MDSDQQDKIAQFCAVTGSEPSTAQTALTSTNWNLEQAVALHLAAADEGNQGQDEGQAESSQHNLPPQQEQPVVTPARRPPGQRPKQMTLSDLTGGRGDDDEDDEEDKNQDMFAGGEKSGLAVQNPNQGGGSGPADHFRNIMNQARSNRGRPGDEDEDEDEEGPRQNNFSGRAQTLGGDDAESQVIEDPTASAPGQQRLERVTRTLHLWADGVSIDDGPLFRFDDPANQDIMQQINQGRAPLSLLDVQPNQEVDLNLIPHKDENYVEPKKTYKPFGGSGQRLGAPTPNAPSASSTPPPAAASSSNTQQQAPAPQVNVDESAPTLQLQIRLGDGSRLQSRFNHSHTIGDVYTFVNQASPASTQRAYALMTTFPSKELDDKALVLGDMSDFKRGGVVVQKWK